MTREEQELVLSAKTSWSVTPLLAIVEGRSCCRRAAATCRVIRAGPVPTAHAWLVPPSLSTMHDHQPQRDVHKLMLVASTVWAQRSTNRNSLCWATMTREHSATTVRAWTWKQGGARFLGCTLTSSLNLVGYKFARVGFRKKKTHVLWFLVLYNMIQTFCKNVHDLSLWSSKRACIYEPDTDTSFPAGSTGGPCTIYLPISISARDGDARGFPACCCWCSSALVLCHERRIAWSNLSHRASVPFSLSLPYHHAVLPASCERGRNWTHEKVAFKLSWLMIDPRIIAPAIRFSHQIRERNEACFFFIHRTSITAAS
jgi:hypothetical protein